MQRASNARRSTVRRSSVIAVAALLAAASVVGSVLAGDGSSVGPSLSDVDAAALGMLIAEWNQEQFAPWPEACDVTTLSVDQAAAMNKAYAALVSRVGTPEFVERYGSRDIAGFQEYQRREAPESVCLGHEVRTLWVEPIVALGSGDIVLRATVWEGWTAGGVDVDRGEIIDVNKIDQTPVHIYLVRKVEAGWRLVAEDRYYQTSADGDMSQYGPDTPHRMEPPTAEWRLD